MEPPSTKADESPKEILKEGDKLGSAPSPVPSLLKGHLAHLTNDGDPESDSGLPDRSSEPNQQPQVDSAGGAVESIGTASSSPPPPLLRHRDSPSSSPRISRIPVPSPLDSPTRDVTVERRHRWSSPVPGSPTHSPCPSLSCDNLPSALPRDRLLSERGSRSDWLGEDPLSLSISSGSRVLPRPPPGKPPTWRLSTIGTELCASVAFAMWDIKELRR